MNHIDILDYEIVINGETLEFPMSYEEVKNKLGEARILEEENYIYYIYDELGISFEGRLNAATWLKREKAYKDAEHNICSVDVRAADDSDKEEHLPEKYYVGNITFFGRQVESGSLNRFMGCYEASLGLVDGEYKWAHVGAYVKGEDSEPNYDGDIFRKYLIISFRPKRPKSKENYNIEQPSGECLCFDNFNFKLAVINELMYEQELLKPYFDIYDYMKFKKANWNLETDKNVRGAVNFFKELQIPIEFADKISKIVMDGGDEIYQNIAPLWDGEDNRFDIDKLTEAEIKQFPNLKEMVLMTAKIETLKKRCEPLGIEVSLL